LNQVDSLQGENRLSRKSKKNLKGILYEQQRSKGPGLGDTLLRDRRARTCKFEIDP